MKKIYGLLVCFLFINSLTTSLNAVQIKNVNLSDLNLRFTSSKIQQIIDSIDESVVENYLRNIVDIGPRLTGTYGAEKAAEYIYDELESLGLVVDYREWEDFGNPYNRRYYRGKNVEGILSGKANPEKDILIFNAHYDTVKDTVGANDDGSGVASVLAAAYALSKFEFNRTIKFLLFSGEEVGLLGSRAYATEAYENNEDIYLEINADMIGCSNNEEDGRTLRLSGTRDTAWIVDKIRNISCTYDLGFDNIHISYMNVDSYRGWSDYFGFMKYGYESMCFWSSGSYNYAHTPEDKIDRVNISYLTRVTKLITATIAYLADEKLEYPQIKITSPKKGKLYFEDRIIKDLRSFSSIVIDDFMIYVDVEKGSAPIDRIEFYYDGKLITTLYEKPYVVKINKVTFRKHLIEAYVYDIEGRAASDFVYLYCYNFLRRK